jgi:PAS domain S-box-containing protein
MVLARDDASNPAAGLHETSLAQISQLPFGVEGMRSTDTGWRDVVETLPQIVWITRPDGYHVYFNQQWMDFTGLSLDESLGDGWNPPFHPSDRPLASELWTSATRSGEPYEIEYRLRRHDGVYRWMLGRARPLRNNNGEIVKWFGTCTDIEEMKEALEDAAQLRETLEQRAFHDSLTGLANRDLLFEQMELMLGQRQRKGIAVAFLDLDRFKAVGEVDDSMDAQLFAQRISEAVRGRVCLAGEQVDVAASVGVTYVEPGDRTSADVALSRADDRMYEAKRKRYPRADK